MKSKKILRYFSIFAIAILAVLVLPGNVLAQTVDLKVDGSNGPVVKTAPTKITVTWSVGNPNLLKNCELIGDILGTLEISPPKDGYKEVDIPATGREESYLYEIECDKKDSGSISDSVSVKISATSTPQVTAKPQAQSGSGGISVDNVPLPVIGYVVKVILYIGILIVGYLIKFAAWGTSFVLSLNQSILDFDLSPFVIELWTIFRDIANLGFVLGIIVIAVATILRYKSYQAQTLLPKLIGAALLVNFSLVIAGSFVKVSDIFSNYFLAAISGNSQNIGAVMTERFSFQNILSNPNYSISDVGFFGLFGFSENTGLLTISSMVIVLVVGFIIFLTLLGFAGMLFLRYFWLVALLALSPLVWLLWVFPHTKQYWDKWWKNFIHWVIYAPTVLLFLYVTVLVLSKAGTSVKGLADSSVGGATAFLVSGASFGDIMISIVAAAFLIMGLKLAQSMGHGGTSLALGTAAKMGTWAKGRARNFSARTLNRGLKATRVEKGAQRLAGWAGGKRGIGGWVARQTAGRVGTRIIKGGAAAEEWAGEDFESAKKRYGGYDKKRLQAMAPGLSGIDRHAAISLLREKKGLDSETIKSMGGPESILAHKNTYDRWGKTKEFSDIEKSLGRNKEIQDAINGLNEAIASGISTNIDAAKTALGEAKDKFTSGFQREDWQGLGKMVFKENFSSLSEGDKEYRLGLAHDINADASGKKYYNITSQLDGDKMYNLFDDLIRAADSRAQLVDNVDAVLQNARPAGASEDNYDYSSIMNSLKGSSEALHKKLYERIKKSIVDDFVGTTTTGTAPPPAPSPPPGPS